MPPDDKRHLTHEELNAGLAEIRRSPKDIGPVRMIVRRPSVGERETLESGTLDTREGLIGDNWRQKGCPMTADGSAHPDMQLNIMNSRVIELVAISKERWPLAGDQIYIDLDLSKDNLPAGTRLELGDAVIEVTDLPHTGCKKFVARFGVEAMKFVNSGVGKKTCLRGINAKVVQSGTFVVGDVARKIGTA